MTNPCDLCGTTDSLDTPGDPSKKIRICKGCGFVHVKERRSLAEVADAWTDIYKNGGYDPEWPGVKARLFYVAEWLDQTIGLRGKSVLDIGAGNGQFLDYVRQRGGNPCGLDPDGGDKAYDRFTLACVFKGYASDETLPLRTPASGPHDVGFDIVTLNWTLENVGSALEVLRYARRCLSPNGSVIVSTGSRIGVPFKKRLNAYLPQQLDYPHDTHCYRWSYISLQDAMRRVGLRAHHSNDFAQRDEMIVEAIVGEPSNFQDKDFPDLIQYHFEMWNKLFP